MEKKSKSYLLLSIGGWILMFVWIFMTVWLTGDREISEFTPADKQIMGAFIAVEIATAVFSAVCLVRWLKLPKSGALPDSGISGQNTRPMSDTEKTANRRVNLLAAIAAVLCVGAEITGIICGKGAAAEAKRALAPLLAAGLLLPFLLILTNLLLLHTVKKRLERMPVAELNQWALSHREQAMRVAENKLRLLRAIRIAAGIYALFLVILGLGDAFLIGFCANGELLTALLFVSVYPAASGMMRLRFAPPRTYFNDNGCYISEEEYPELYEVCRRAAREMGKTGNIHIGLTPEVNAGIAEIGDEYSVMLGTGLLALFTEDEVYHILLHEFAHIHGAELQKENRFYFWLSNESRCGILIKLRAPLFVWLDEQYDLQMNLYRFAATIGEETQADRAMAEHGSAEVAASALMKLKYAELYAWESQSQSRPTAETLDERLHELVIGGTDAIRQAMHERAPFYRELCGKEIIARNASHPTFRMRLEILDADDAQLSFVPDNADFRKETEQAAKKLEKFLKDRNAESDYAEFRAGLLKTVTDWEEAGRPLQEEEYRDTVDALKNLGRMDEAMALCDRAIRELPGSAYAHFMRGCYRLHRWDSGGIEDIYAALDDNLNYMEEGMEQIGAFCCLTGNQEELDRYREKATEFAQQKKDEGDELITLNKNDQLSAESLPPEIEERIRSYVESLDEGQIDRMYLIRKQINAVLYTSAMVVCFVSGTEEKVKDETMHKVFLCLDNIPDWQFSLFDYEDVKIIKPDEIKGSLFYLGAGNKKKETE